MSEILRMLFRRIGKGLSVLMVFGLASLGSVSPLFGQSSDHGVNYAEDVAPILQDKCVECHRPNSIAPMSLLTYEEAKVYAPLIKYMVDNRIMPPWGLNPTVGIQEYKNDREITEEQRQTLIQWVDAGAPLGEENQIPPIPEFPEGEFFWYLGDQLGEPDLIIDAPSVSVASKGPDKWHKVTIPSGITEERWIRAVEVRPANDASRTVVHHALASIVQDEPELVGIPQAAREHVRGPGLLFNYAAGKGGHIFKPDSGKLMLPDSAISWEIHTTTKDLEVPEATVKLGLWFNDERPESRTVLSTFSPTNSHGVIDIPPGEIAVHQGTWVLPASVRVESMQPHMHMRGKAMKAEAIYPDGRREVLVFVDNFQWDLQNTYVFADDVAPLLPAGTVLMVTSWHDNRAENPNNPDPRQWVGWGDRKVDEMAIQWMDLTYLEQETFNRLVAERERVRALKNR